MKVQTAATLAKNAYLRICAYGEPGTGKTWFGASACLDPATWPVLFCDFRAQVTSLRSKPEFLEAIEDGRLVIVTLDEYNDLNHIYTYLFTQNPQLPIAAHFTEHGPPKTLVVDSITELQRAEVMRIAGNIPGKFLRDVQPPEIRDWGTLLNQFTLLAHLFYELPMHVIFCGLEGIEFGKHKVGEQAPVTGYRLAMQGQGQRQFPAYSHTLMRFERAHNVKTAFGKLVFVRAVTQDIRAKTKEQTGMIPAVIGDPTIPYLAKLLRGSDEA